MTLVVGRFSSLNIEEAIWKEVLELVTKKERILKMLQKARQKDNPEDVTKEKKIAKEMLKEMGLLIKVLLWG